MRLFVAVWPPPELLERIASLERPVREGVRWTTADQWHITLRFLGEADPGRTTARLAGGTSLPGAVAVAGPRTTCLSPSILCVPVEGLTQLAAAIPVGEADAREFRGHLTLARARRGATVRGLEGEPIEGTWWVERVDLVSSTLHPRGAVYATLASRAVSPHD